MDDGDITVAIDLFRYSNTALSNRRAHNVMLKLRDLHGRHEIGFHTLPRRTLRGTHLEGRIGHDLRLNTAYFDRLPAINRLPALSLLLVHEATHATVDFDDLYDEMAARMLPILYFRELSESGVVNEHNDPPRPGATVVVRLGPGSFPEFEEQRDALRRDQLIDYILDIRTYRRSQYITPQWIVDNLTHWSGLRNRWPKTRGRYIRLLAPSTNYFFTPAMIDIMESVAARKDWDEMMDYAGSLRAIQIAFDRIAGQAQYGGRIVALERRWAIRLRSQD